MVAGRLALCLLVLLPPILASCRSSPSTRFLTLDVATPTQSKIVPYAGLPVQVQAVHLPAEMDRWEVVQQTGPNALNVDDFARWGAPPGELVQRALSLDLAARLPTGAIVFPAEPVSPTTRGLSVELRAFRDGAEGATLEASWTVLAGAAQGRAVLIRRSERLAIGSAGKGSDAVAEDLTQLLGLLADSIAAELPAIPNRS